MNTQPIPSFPNESSVSLHTSARKVSATSIETGSVSWHEVRPGRTINVPTESDLIRFPKRPAREEPQAALPLVAAIEGTVIEVDAHTVRCSVRARDQMVEISLLPDLFPEHPQFGMTFELAMITVSGVQQPSLTIRNSRVVEDDLSHQADEILASFR